MSRVYLALGSNLGDSAALIQEAIVFLSQLPQTCLIASSSLYQTIPVGMVGTESEDFVNAVLALDTELGPMAMLDAVMAIEQKLGRDRSIQKRNHSRKIDIDILLYDRLILISDSLELPHPRFHQRAFVLIPLWELVQQLEPELVHPELSCSIAQLAEQLSVEQQGWVKPCQNQVESVVPNSLQAAAQK